MENFSLIKTQKNSILSLWIQRCHFQISQNICVPFFGEIVQFPQVSSNSFISVSFNFTPLLIHLLQSKNEFYIADHLLQARRYEPRSHLNQIAKFWHFLNKKVIIFFFVKYNYIPTSDRESEKMTETLKEAVISDSVQRQWSELRVNGKERVLPTQRKRKYGTALRKAI